MGGENEGDVVELFGQEASHRDVPGVGVDEVDLLQLFHRGQIQREGVDRGFELLPGVSGDGGRWFVAADVEISGVFVLGSPAMDFNLKVAGELAGEVFDVDAGAAVDGGRVFAGHDAYTHWAVSVGLAMSFTMVAEGRVGCRVGASGGVGTGAASRSGVRAPGSANSKPSAVVTRSRTT